MSASIHLEINIEEFHKAVQRGPAESADTMGLARGSEARALYERGWHNAKDQVYSLLMDNSAFVAATHEAAGDDE